MSRPSESVVPLGQTGLVVRLSIDGGTLLSIAVQSSPPTRQESAGPSIDRAVKALARWPDGDAGTDWVDLPCFPRTGTAFQRAVWRALCRIPPGETTTYGEIAAGLARPGAARAVGQAVNANPWAPLVPCHRVLAAGGRPGGYARGLAMKRQLLAAEGVTLPEAD